jgi:hypothetical protein
MVEDVRRVAQAWQQQNRWTAATPVEHFEMHSRCDINGECAVPRTINRLIFLAARGSSSGLEASIRAVSVS